MAVDIIARALGGNALGQISNVDEKIIEWLEQLGFITLLYTDDGHVACDENGNPLIYRVSSGGGGGAVESVNGKTGAVVLVPSDLGIDLSNYYTKTQTDSAIAAAIGNVDTLIGSGVIS